MNTQQTIEEIIARSLCTQRGIDPDGATIDGRRNFECFLDQAHAVRASIQAYLPADMTPYETTVAKGESGTVTIDDIVFADIWQFDVKSDRRNGEDSQTRVGTIDCAYILNGSPEEEGKLRDGAKVGLKLYIDNGKRTLSGNATITSVDSVEGWRHDGFWKSQFNFLCDEGLVEEEVGESDWHVTKPSPSA